MEVPYALHLLDGVLLNESTVIPELRIAWKTIRETLNVASDPLPEERGAFLHPLPEIKKIEPQGVAKWRTLLSKMKQGDSVELPCAESDAFRFYVQHHGGEAHTRHATDTTRLVYLLKVPDDFTTHRTVRSEQWRSIVSTMKVGDHVELPNKRAGNLYEFIIAHCGEAHTKQNTENTRFVYLLKHPVR